MNGKAITVLTTPERVDYYRIAVGDLADFRLSAHETLPLDCFLANLAAEPGETVIIDEAHFEGVSQLVEGLARYVDNPLITHDNLRCIVVSSYREPGDRFLSFLVGYCWIADVIYATSAPGLVDELVSVLKTPRSRLDVYHLLEPCLPTYGQQDAAIQAQRLEPFSQRVVVPCEMAGTEMGLTLDIKLEPLS